MIARQLCLLVEVSSRFVSAPTHPQWPGVAGCHETNRGYIAMPMIKIEHMKGAQGE